MKNLNLKINNNTNIDAYFLVDGKKPKFKKNEFGNYECLIETEKDEVELKVFEWNEYKSALWLVMSIVYFFISLFGIFDIKQDKRFRSIDCHFKIKLQNEENNLKLVYNGFKDGDIAIVHEGDCDIEVLSNKYFIDTKSMKRYKIVKGIKVALWMFLIVAIFLFLR